MAKRVGVIGLGIMGGAFAQNLVKAGWEVIGYDIDAARNRAGRRDIGTRGLDEGAGPARHATAPPAKRASK